MPSPEPRTVWMVRAGSGIVRKGTLALQGGDLVFAAEEHENLSIPTSTIRRAARRPGTPILSVRYREPDGNDARAFFYFVEPPPLPAGDRSGEQWRLLLPSSRGLHRAAAAMTLREAGRLMKPKIREWVGAIREVGEGLSA